MGLFRLVSVCGWILIKNSWDLTIFRGQGGASIVVNFYGQLDSCFIGFGLLLYLILLSFAWLLVTLQKV